MRHKQIHAGLLVFIFCIFSAHATNIGSVTIADRVLGSRTIVYENVFGNALVEGDILIGKVSVLSAQRASILPKVWGSPWPNGIVPYELSEHLPFPNKLATLQAIDHWQQKTNLQFIELTAKNRSKYRDFITFIPAPGTTCASYVGKQGGEQVIQLAPRCTTMNTVHEIGHALGLWHEQSRTDRDQYIRIIWDNIEDDHRFNFEQHLTDGEDFGDYDYQSIMHYSAYAFSKNGEQTIVPLLNNVEIGQREQLSEKDIAAIRILYPAQ